MIRLITNDKLSYCFTPNSFNPHYYCKLPLLGVYKEGLALCTKKKIQTWLLACYELQRWLVTLTVFSRCLLGCLDTCERVKRYVQRSEKSPHDPFKPSVLTHLLLCMPSTSLASDKGFIFTPPSTSPSSHPTLFCIEVIPAVFWGINRTAWVGTGARRTAASAALKRLLTSPLKMKPNSFS